MIVSLLAIATLAGGFLIGLVPTLIDGVQKPMYARLKVPEGSTDWFTRLFYLTWLPAMPLAGWMLEAWNPKDVLFGGLTALILGVAWLALARTLLSLLLNALFMGLAYSFVTVAAVSLMPLVFFPPDLGLAIASLNLGFVTVGLGAMLGPWLVWSIDRWCSFRQGLLYFSCVLIVPAALAALCEREPISALARGVTTWEEAIAHPGLGLIVVVLLLYFAIENCLEFWPEAYLKELDYRDRGLQVCLTGFWLAFILSRGAAAWLLYVGAEYPHFAFIFTIVLVVLSAAVLGNLTGGFEAGSGTIGLWLLGACYGPLLPGFLGMAFDMYGKPLPASLLGALLALSAIDTLFMRPVMNAFGQGSPARRVMRVPTVLALVLAAPLLLLALIRN